MTLAKVANKSSTQDIVGRSIGHRSLSGLSMAILRPLPLQGSILLCHALWSPKKLFVFCDSHAELLSSGFDSRKKTIPSGEGGYVSDGLGDQLLGRIRQAPVVDVCGEIDVWRCRLRESRLWESYQACL